MSKTGANETFVPRLTNPAEAKVLDVPAVVALEQAIAAQGTSLAVLMDRAGASIAHVVRTKRPDRCNVVVLCGTGNNGGDGWVAADLLARDGYQVTLLSPCEAELIKAEPAHAAALRTMRNGNVDVAVTSAEGDSAAAGATDRLRRADVVIDAILGTGFSSDKLRGSAEGYVRALEGLRDERLQSGQPVALVVAADVPSGLSAQTGEAAEPCERADVTVTMLAMKPGLLSDIGKSLCGQTVVADLVAES